MSFASFGSSLSLRSFSRHGSAFSVNGLARMGSAVSLFDCMNMGSTLSMRGFSRIGSALSVWDKVHLGSTLSVGNDAHFGSTLSINDSLHFSNTNTYVKYVTSPSAGLETTVDNHRSMSITSTGGTLHGTWTADNTVTASDRRLKKSIVPLYKAVADTARAAGTEAPDLTQRPVGGSERSQVVNWVLRELRPVSFKFKQGPDAKHSRYGFVAQELQQVLPGVVRGQGDKHLSVVYQDMIALLTMAAQSLQDKVNQQEDTIQAMMKRIKELDEKLEERTRWFKAHAMQMGIAV